MNKKKGFTLVELLAVIVILALVALIATPIILNVINDAKKQAALESLKGYIDGAEKAIMMNKVNEDSTFPKADENGCYDLKQLDEKINIKGTKPKIDSDAKVCFQNGEATSISGLAFGGYNVEYKNGKYLINGKVVEKDDKKELTGIASKEYTQGEKVSYLGYNWLVMKDNGTSTQLAMDGYLSRNELIANLPSDVEESNVSSNGYVQMCLSKESAKYCFGKYDESGNFAGTDYSWNKSIVKPIVENWINSKMNEKGLNKTVELKGMSFTDGVETINGYVRLPLYDEVKSMKNQCSQDDKNLSGSPYCADNSNYMLARYDYWTLSKFDNDTFFTYSFQINGSHENTIIYGSVSLRYSEDDSSIRPVITVNEK